MGRILRVDLTTEQITVEPLTPAVARMWLGGTGLGAKILYDEVPAGVEWDSPQNRLIIADFRGQFDQTDVGEGNALPFGLQLWLFASPVAYPLSVVPAQWRLGYHCERNQNDSG